MGKSAAAEPDPERWSHPLRAAAFGAQPGWSEVASGLTAVWARGNTREALFDAMKRNEVYATTGTRLKVQMFGGWNFKPGDDKRSDYLALVMLFGCSSTEETSDSGSGSSGGDSDMTCDEGDSKEECMNDIL